MSDIIGLLDTQVTELLRLIDSDINNLEYNAVHGDVVFSRRIERTIMTFEVHNLYISCYIDYFIMRMPFHLKYKMHLNQYEFWSDTQSYTEEIEERLRKLVLLFNLGTFDSERSE